MILHYIKTSKHPRISAFRIHYMLIVSESIVNKGKRNVNLLIEHLLLLLEKLLRPLTGKPKPKGPLRKNIILIAKSFKKNKMDQRICMGDVAAKENENIDKLAWAIIHRKQMRIHLPLNLKPSTNLDET